MSEPMKHRLVGAIVLGCLAIIFIPIILDGEGVQISQMQSNIPPAPALPKRPVIEPPRPQILSDELVKEAEVSVTEAEVVPQQPQLDKQGLPDAWSVRLASFGEQENAKALVARLLKQGYKAYSRTLGSSQGKLEAVYIGPVLTKSETEALLSELEAEFGLEGIAVKFSIAELEH